MEFGVGTNVTLGVAFLAVGALASILQFWLWTFPMVPDPSGVDPNGVTTAPRFWRYTHRALGYVFVGVFLAMMVQMVPRLWEFPLEGWSGTSVVHSALGLMVGVLLIGKVLILRRFQRLGNRLLIVGSLVLLLSVGAVALVTPPALKVIRHPGDEQARRIILQNCTTCHGLGVVSGESEEPGKWREILGEMAEKAAEKRVADPSQGQEERLVAFLASLNPHGEGEEEEGEGEFEGRSRRERGDEN